MTLKSFIAHEIGIVEGLFAADWNMVIVKGTHAVQQEMTLKYGDAAVKTCAAINDDTTMTGREKLFYVADAIVATAIKDGWKVEAAVLGHLAVSIAQQAFLQIEPNIGSGIVAIAAAASASPVVAIAAELIAPVVQAGADAAAAKIGGSAQQSLAA